MKTRSALIFLPGYPFALKALCPCASLASVAGSLLEAGHSTQVWDFGTVHTLGRVFPREHQALVNHLIEKTLDASGEAAPLQAFNDRWLVRKADKAFCRRRDQLCAEIAGRLAAVKGLDFAVFYLANADDAAAALSVVRRLRKSRSSLRVVAVGPFAEWFPESLLRADGGLDCVCLANPDITVMLWAEQLDRPDLWPGISNLACAAGGRVQFGPRRRWHGFAGVASPTYDPKVYPALRDGGKLWLFSIEDTRGCGCRRHACPHPAEADRVHVKSPVLLCDEMERLRAWYGARAFHFNSAGTPMPHLVSLAQVMLARGMKVTYCRSLPVQYMPSGVLTTLRDSGCAAVALQIDSGSQRLLDDFYGTAIGVSQIEQAVRACKAAGLYTVTRFTYPSPADDYHTRAETLRLIERTRPDAALVGMPFVVPQSTWYDRAEAFGFGPVPRDYSARVLRSRAQFPLLPHRRRNLPHRVGRLSPAQLVWAHEDLVRAIEYRGISTSAAEEVAVLARFTERIHCENELGSHLTRCLLAGDVNEIGDLVGQFNRAVCERATVLTFRPYTALPEAVGN